MAIETFGQYKPNRSIEDFTKDGKCSGCGNCCPNMLPMTDSEIKRIKAYIARNNIKPHKIGLPIAGPIVDITCPFLDNDKPSEKCRIYPVRPSVCRCFLCSDVEGAKERAKRTKERRRTIDVKNTFYQN